MKAFPDEFEGMLTPRGRSVLAGRDVLCGALDQPGAKFVRMNDVVDPDKAARGLAALERELLPLLEPIDEPIPPETITEMQFNYEEWLPKAVRVRTAYFDSPEERAWDAAERIGLVAMMRSGSFRAFAQAVAGQALHSEWGMQVLCYGPGDYTGPHNDHHPEDAEAKDGYVDVHVSLANASVSSHFLVYEKAGHLSEMVDVNTLGGVNAYRLPFWHYTTPLQAKAGEESRARRWLLLGTFLYDAQVRATTAGSR